MIIHGSLVNVNGVGILLRGEAGSGKSESALKLVSAGHSLVADDVVEIKNVDSALIGEAPVEMRQLIAIRGIGIIDVVEAFGRKAFMNSCRIDAIVDLTSLGEQDLLFEEIAFTEFSGSCLPAFRISNATARDIPLLVETASTILRLPRSFRRLDSIPHAT